MMRRALILLILLTASAVEAQVPARPDAQRPVGKNLQVPPDWQVRLDAPDPAVVVGADAEAADIFFVSMTPGWHITTGPGAIFYHPGSTAAGDYHAEAKIHLFDPGARREAFGLMATNVLGVTVAGDEVSFLVNGQEVARLPRLQVATDGLFGFRVNHHLNLHISTLAVEPR